MKATVLAKTRSPTDRAGTGSVVVGASAGAELSDAFGSAGAAAGGGGDASEAGGTGVGVVAATDGAAAVASLGGAVPPPQAATDMTTDASATAKLRELDPEIPFSDAPFMREP
jgi:hypothetical protein